VTAIMLRIGLRRYRDALGMEMAKSRPPPMSRACAASSKARCWDDPGVSIVEHIAGVEDYQVALATYRAACERWPGTPITLRQGARVIEDSRRLRVV